LRDLEPADRTRAEIERPPLGDDDRHGERAEDEERPDEGARDQPILYDQDRESEDREERVRGEAHADVDDRRGRSALGADTSPREGRRSQRVSTDRAEGQKVVRGFARPAEEIERSSELKRELFFEQRSPAERIERERDRVKGDERDDAPPCAI